MSINIHNKDGLIKDISVTGELDTGDDISYFLKLLEYEKKIYITFFQASTLPVDVINALSNLQDLEKVKIYVLKRYLYSYLTNLGIKCKFIENKSLITKSETLNQNNNACEFDTDAIKDFLKDIFNHYGYDYTDYQMDSIKRRIKISMLRENITDLNNFREIVLTNEEVFEQLFLDFSINTTDFFRDPEVYADIKNKILPYLDSYAHIKIWCVGCSNGKEPYSLAILLKELNMLEKTQIYATDINPYVIEEAKNGLFPINTLETDILTYRNIGGQKNFVDYFGIKGRYLKVNDELKKNILFFQHSLVGSGILNEFQLILCRNVLIYFNPSLQQKVIENFYNSLDTNGFMILGKSEGLLQNGGSQIFNKYHEENKIYRRKEQ